MPPGRYPYAGPRETSRGPEIDLRRVENGYLLSCTTWPEEEDDVDDAYLPEELQQRRYHPPRMRRYVFTSREGLLAWLSQRLLEEEV